MAHLWMICEDWLLWWTAKEKKIWWTQFYAQDLHHWISVQTAILDGKLTIFFFFLFLSGRKCNSFPLFTYCIKNLSSDNFSCFCNRLDGIWKLQKVGMCVLCIMCHYATRMVKVWCIVIGKRGDGWSELLIEATVKPSLSMDLVFFLYVTYIHHFSLFHDLYIEVNTLYVTGKKDMVLILITHSD